MATPLVPRKVPHRAPSSASSPSPDVQAGALDNVSSLDPVRRLVDRARHGDKGAYGQIFRLHHDAIFRFARLHFGAEAEDVVTDVFTRAWIQLPNFPHTGVPFVAWLYGIARDVVADEAPRRTRPETPLETPLEPRPALADTLATWAEDDRLKLAEAIAKLPAESRQVIEMTFLMAMRNPEVAEALDTTTYAVDAEQWQSLTALRDDLEANA